MDQYIVRFPDGARDKIKEMAARNRRSMNAEIVMAILAWLDRYEKTTGEGFQERSSPAENAERRA